MKKINSSEISSVIKKQIEDFQGKIEVKKTGTVVEVGDGIAQVYGLQEVMASEILLFPNDIYGMVLNLEEDLVGAVLFGSDEDIKEGDEVVATGKIAEVPVGKNLISRVVNSLGQSLDDKGDVSTDKTRQIDVVAPGVVDRQPVKEALQTGIKAIDSMIPIGRGQRELIVGDRQVGKTAICVDAVINQKKSNVICIYVSIGKKNSEIARLVKTLEDHDAMKHTIIVSASASDPAPLQYIAPYAATAMGEEFRDNGEHVLIIYDDLSKHAQSYRQLSLLLRRPPGREAYPGDIFYLHSRLLERAAKLSDDLGGGSLTAIPIVETQAGDISAYIPTNLISITDGQIYLGTDLFHQGVKPAINVGLSVSRVGGNAQIKGMKQVAGSLRLDMSQYREKEAFAQFGTELDKTTLNQLERGKRLVEILKQGQYRPMAVEEQVVIIYCGVRGLVDDVPVEDISRFEEELLSHIKDKKAGILKSIAEEKQVSQKTEDDLKQTVKEFKSLFVLSTDKEDKHDSNTNQDKSDKAEKKEEGKKEAKPASNKEKKTGEAEHKEKGQKEDSSDKKE
jgi:F-type H+-transporting ATPase subunit alpha